MDHSMHPGMDHSSHGGMGHSSHGGMDHSSHGGMDHSRHAGMDHSMHGNMDHSMHSSPGAITAQSHGPGSYHLMQMSFHFGYNETVLLEVWKIDSYASLIVSMIGIFILAVLYEGLKCYRDYLSWRVLKGQHYQVIQVPGEANTEVKEVSSAEASIGSHRASDPSVERAQIPRWLHCVQTVFHVLQVTMSMLLMLIFMTYNLWLCLSVVTGAGFGYFLFGWRRYQSSSDVRQQCH